MVQYPGRPILLAISLVVVLGTGLSGQSSLQKANKEYELRAFNRAIESYQAHLRERPNDLAAMGNLADCYRHINEMEKAAEYYREAIRARRLDPIHLLNYGKVLKALQRYREAKYYFEQYARSNRAIGEHYAETCDFARDLEGKEPPYQVVNERINTPASEFGATFLGDRVVFSSSRIDLLSPRVRIADRPDNQMYIASIGNDGFLGSIAPYRIDQDPTYSEGPASFALDRDMVAYMSNNFVSGTRPLGTSGMALRIFLAELSNGGDWRGEREFPFNDPRFAMDDEDRYSVGFPAFSPNGNALYFASDQPGGIGGYDIYVSYRTETAWSAPENLGPIVNTPGDEISPYFDGNMLFFSSDWHHGLGGYDVFRAERSGSGFSRIVHLGEGVNSSYDDYDFIYDTFRNLGYLTSNRPYGPENTPDIYRVFKSADNVEIRVTNASDGDPIPNAIVDFTSCGEGRYRTDRSGIYSFQVVEGLTCDLVVSADGYRSKGMRVSTAGLRQNRTYEIALNRLGEEYYGQVIDYSNGRPLDGVLVTAVNQETGGRSEATTDARGGYTLALSPEATYVVRYSRPGYRDINQTVRPNVTGNQAMLREVSMAPVDMSLGDEIAPGFGQRENPPGETPSTISSGYAVQLAAVGQPDLTGYDNLNSLGTVYAKPEGSFYKIRLGVFASRQEAQNALNTVKRRGFPDAFIVAESGGSMQRKGGTEATGEFTEPATGALGRYMIQLGAYSDPAYFDGSRVSDYGVIEDRRKGNLTIKLLAGYDTMSDAQRALSAARSLGFPDAFIVTEEGGSLRKVR